MTKLLERAIAEAAALPEQAQDALASRLLEGIEDERGWDARFAATTDRQWDALTALARAGKTSEGEPYLDLDDVVRGQRG